MRRVALDLRKHVAPGHGLKLEIIKASELQQDLPLPKLHNHQMSGGSLVLNEVLPGTRFAACITVAKQRSAF